MKILALFLRLWSRLFRGQVPADGHEVSKEVKEDSTNNECGDSHCHGRSDPRCQGGNCTLHCRLSCPPSTCHGGAGVREGMCGDSSCHGRSDPRCQVGNCSWHCYAFCATCPGQDRKAQSEVSVETRSWLLTCFFCQSKNRVPMNKPGKVICGKCKLPLTNPNGTSDGAAIN